MKHLSLLLLSITITTNSTAQKGKSPIDSNSIYSWPYLSSQVFISNNGKYFAYNIENQPVNSTTLVLRSTTDSWNKRWPGAHPLVFAANNKQLIFTCSDTLYFFQTSTGKLQCIPNVSAIQQPRYQQGQWLAYKFKNGEDLLILQNLVTAKKWRFPAVIDYTFDNNGQALLLKTAAWEGNRHFIKLQYVSLPSGNITDIWTSADFPDQDLKITNYCIDESGSQGAFTTANLKAGQTANSIWYYKKGMEKAVLKANHQTADIQLGLLVDDQTLSFSEDGHYIFFNLKIPEIKSREIVGPENLDIWSYRDTILHSLQLLNPQTPSYRAVISTNSNKIIQLEKENEFVVATPPKGDFVVVLHRVQGDRFWLGINPANPAMPNTNYLLSLKDGTITPIKTAGFSLFTFSPDGKYLVYYDGTKDNADYYSYDLSTGKTINISSIIPRKTLAFNNEFYTGTSNIAPSGIAGWLQGGAGLLVYDNYDIWLLDPTGNNQPKNITNGYGRTNHTRLRLANEQDRFHKSVLHKKDASLLLTGFNVNTKYNGFYRKQVNRRGDPELLTMGPWTLCYEPGYQATATDHTFSHGMSPFKAVDTDTWVVQRQTSSEAPNYFLTTDFKNYKALTNLYPQQEYNWLTTELLTWKQLDGIMSQGILYKPENFDPKKQYPVLFNYYQQFSGRMYEYPEPAFMTTNINIPWFVSRGYLVFTPDIHFTVGKFGQSAYNTLVSAAQMLSRLPYVDAKHMGLNGHSAAGYSTNYLVTHTDIFAAALEGAGVSDIISSALQLGGDGRSRLAGSEYLHGGSLWEKRNDYLENSPILNADKVTTPLLIFHNKGDGAVPWEQAVELFVALRRLQKPVWMMQYNNNSHGVSGKDAIDFTIRVTQFFDHYLKGAPPPIWMTEGIPARLKGIKTGYELDTSGKVP
ncbi:prolyl oligopeptidase family serine peptidase [Chitinophaga sp. GbtcB8]|uniref:S9 family peptidase n=1 Tax=Chitinophaga sp. GbtcB8 TaxID=2824753 RepID=UPI001C307AB8|nr:prolyl oligopeptidase family serine peptidase [Chitinophaga sp. GbtcB8]